MLARLMTVTLLAGFAAAPAPALAQAYPSQDIHFICGAAPGSGADIIVRFFAEKMRPLMGRTIIVENKVGASGNLATEYVARSKPDGHTVFIVGGSNLSANQHVLKNPTVDVGNALQIATTINKQPLMFAVRPDAPWKTMAELTAHLKQKGDKASYGQANSPARVAGALYTQLAGLKAVEVPYKNYADYMNDLASGQLDFAIPDNVAAAAMERAGKMRLLSVTTGQRMQATPHIPTMTEQGFPMDIQTWWAFFVPAATPRPVVDQINKWVHQVVLSDDGRKFLREAAADPWVTTPDEAQAYFRAQIAKWAEYVRVAKIEPQG